jgi:hypothetical protein
MIVLSAVVGASLAAGCGGDGDGGGDVTTGIAPTKLLSDVTEDEATSACQRLEGGYNRVFQRDKVIRSICTLSAAALADTSADCVTYRDQCIEETSMPGSETSEELDDIEFECADDAFSECTGTVGELEACFNDTLDILDGLLNQFSCDDAASVQPEDLEGISDTLVDPPTSCESLGCPGGLPFAPDEEQTEETQP